VILAFIGVKLILTFLHDLNPAIPHIPTPVSLAVILGVLAITTAASVVAARRDPSRRAHAGNLRAHQQDQPSAERSRTVRR
jgi:tellurite resistance protein TerC